MMTSQAAILRFLAASSSMLPRTAARGFDVVGWYVGTNTSEWPIERINWSAYSTIRPQIGMVVDQVTGNCSCPSDPFFVELLAAARKHGKTVTLSSGSIAGCYGKMNASRAEFCANYVATLGPAVRSCGRGIQGIEFDHEGDRQPTWAPGIGEAGIVSRQEAHQFTALMDAMQRSMGGSYTVSECIGVWGFDGAFYHGSSYPFNLATPWVDAKMIKANPNLFVNTMSYHMPLDCSLRGWKIDAFVVNKLWGIPRSQINIGINYYTFNVTKQFEVPTWKANPGEPTWHRLSPMCPNVDVDECRCHGIAFPSKLMNYEIGQMIAKEGFRGAFPWAANYDSFDFNNSLVTWLDKGLKSSFADAGKGTEVSV